MPSSEPSSRLYDAADAVIFAARLHLAGAWKLYAAVLVGIAVVWVGACLLFFKAPAGFPVGLVTIESGQSLGGIADRLEAEHVIGHPLLFEALVRMTGRANRIQAGAYLFKAPAGVANVARRVAYGDTGVTPERITFTEGMASFDMARVLLSAMPGFDANAFEALAAPHEGYLFPDTYQILPGTSPAAIVERLTGTYDAKTASLAPDFAASSHTQRDVIIVASLVEREAATPADRRIVAGIIWHRLSIPMRLQIDAPFGYLHQQDSYVPTSADTQSDSPYNTYRNDGLPPGPIANPGLDAIEAALHPTETDYLYYVTGSDGTMHYAKTFDEHKANVAKYL